MDWTRGPTIGRGATATVSLATDVSSGDLFAVKYTELSQSEPLQREQFLLSQLNSQRIVKYLGSDITSEGDKTLYNVFMEYVPGGALSDVIRRRGNGLDEDRIQLHTRQIVMGLEYLHFNGLVHCDIKSENVLVRDDGAVIADLGCAKSVRGNGSGSVFSGTPLFMAPEVARGEEQSFPADVWALGCTVIEMATGCNPWPEVDDPVSALYRIGFSDDVPEFPTWLSEKGRDFLDKCLKRNPRERWTAEELLEHPFLEPNSKQATEIVMKSPTSVLDDQGLWDRLEALATPAALNQMGSSSKSPSERLRGLNEGSNPPNWTRDEDWITVRSNHSSEETTTLISTTMASFDYGDEEVPGISILDDNLFLQNSPVNITSSSTSKPSGIVEGFPVVLRYSILGVKIRTSFRLNPGLCFFAFQLFQSISNCHSHSRPFHLMGEFKALRTIWKLCFMGKQMKNELTPVPIANDSEWKA